MNIYLIGMLVSFIIYIVLGFVISRKVKNANDFYVAGRKAPVFLIVGSMIASYVSTGMFMGDAGEYYNGLFSPMTILATMQVVGYIYGAVFFGRYLRRSKVITIPDFFGRRFCSEKVKKLATITSIITMMVYLLSVMQGIGTLMNVVTGVDYNVCIVIAVIVFAIVSITSGAAGVLITDTIMFSVFTIALVISVFVITGEAGSWGAIVDRLVHFTGKQGLLSWAGNTDYLYSTGGANVLWGIIYGVVWMSVCMVGPWQSSRYIMAKNEHTVIRSAFYSAFGIFILQLLVGIAAVTVNIINPELESASHVLIWASMNILPKAVGVILLTGVLAAGISSATTFLSLIGSSVANDIYKGKGDVIKVGRIAMVLACFIVLVLAVLNPPQIFWIMFFGGSIVASSWMPVAVASILSKRVTKAGAFWGMLMGFLGCFAIKLYASISGATLPVYLDSTVVGMVLNVCAMIIATLLTKVTEDEKKAKAVLMVVPEEEKNPKDVRITMNYLKATIILGAVIAVILLLVWAIPVMKAL
ncbi:MAG: sodium:solute symporter family protein [Lachnospiraceae bacterium]|nr:sodium:solute symporter family protein [Lachnospiraceae bacterium]